jgi:hypothetical protein
MERWRDKEMDSNRETEMWRDREEGGLCDSEEDRASG